MHTIRGFFIGYLLATVFCALWRLKLYCKASVHNLPTVGIQKQNIPPGPQGAPIIGSLPTTNDNFATTQRYFHGFTPTKLGICNTTVLGSFATCYRD